MGAQAITPEEICPPSRVRVCVSVSVNVRVGGQFSSNSKVVLKINFKVFVENVKKAEGTFSNESIYEKK